MSSDLERVRHDTGVEKGGGYEYEFVEEVGDKYICSTCTKVLRDPHLTECCGKHFCESCLQQLCPHCHKENFHHLLNKERKNEIDKLKIRCTNHKLGCKWVGELNSVESHLSSEKGCGYVMVDCTNHCRELVPRKNLIDHVTRHCLSRTYECKYCGEEDTYQSITGDHYHECPNFPIDCLHKCGATGIKRRECGIHLNKCPLEPVDCPLKDVGCQEMPRRKELDSHMTNNQQQHLLTLTRAFRKNREELEAMRATQQVIATDVVIMQGSKKKLSDLALASIKSQLEMRTFRLTSNGSPLTMRLTDFSFHKETDKVWHSPPFYYEAGYKMQLAVYANGAGDGAGTHVSIFILLMEGEFDDQLQWPINSPNQLRIKMKKQQGHRFPSIKKPGKQELATSNGSPSLSEHRRIFSFESPPASPKLQIRPECIIPVNNRKRIAHTENVRQVGGAEKFVDHSTVDNFMLLTNSIVLNISVTEC